MIQDLVSLAISGKANPEPLTAIGFGHILLEQASRMSHELGNPLARYKGEDEIDYEYLKLRNKAYTHLKEAVDEIRACGLSQPIPCLVQHSPMYGNRAIRMP
ncbi:MAG: hypothetical protein ACQER7_04150 [Bacteroidota bacterium]